MLFFIIAGIVLIGTRDVSCAEQPMVYTIPSKLDTWHPVNPRDLVCDFEYLDSPGDCTETGDEDFSILKTGFGGEITVDGYTCTGITLTTSSYTGFFGGVTLTFSQSHFVPDLNVCKNKYIEKIERPSEYEASLLHPPHESSWLRTVDTTISSYLIVTGALARFDPYTSHFVSSLFPGGECVLDQNMGVCGTTLQHTLWFSKTPSSSYCNIFEPTKMKRFGKDNKACGYKDSHGFYRSSKGACMETICGKTGWRFTDGFVMFGDKMETTLHCTPETTVSIHTALIDSREDHIRSSLRGWKEDCLDAQEDILFRGIVSIRKLGYFRNTVPGPGKAYRAVNGSIEACDVIYIPVYKWSDLVKNETCLYVDNNCMDSVNGQFFNGITTGPNGRVLIPDKDLLSGIYDEYFQITHEVDVRHPAIRVISDHVEVLDNTSTQPKSSKVYSPITFGFGFIGDWLMTAAIGLALLVTALAIIKKGFDCISRLRARSTSRDPENGEIVNRRRRLSKDNSKELYSFRSPIRGKNQTSSDLIPVQKQSRF